ncbi:MAG: mercury methylation corrinoid protein HgcA [Candidatus Bathyarchaeota archaeon]|nr:mercury methylation corrinoid protein HgcA [Candidatus Bathyarchaeota archaeon]
MPEMESVGSEITLADRWDHFLARIGVNQMSHIIEPGLYVVGYPSPYSPVFVTANYTLSFDALRSNLHNVDAYIMVLDTEGVNVWCAAGWGTFGTSEVVDRIAATRLGSVVSHRKLILPQLSASGVSAFEVKKLSGFTVEYGPIMASDIPEFLKTQNVTSEMRRVRFDLKDRLVLIPVEIKAILLPMIITALIFYFIGGTLSMTALLVSLFAGIALFPALLPWIPTKDFSSKGFILGISVAIPFTLSIYVNSPTSILWMKLMQASIPLLMMAPVTSYLALNFTGSTPYTSRSGVRREIFKYIPFLPLIFGAGIILNLIMLLIL